MLLALLLSLQCPPCDSLTWVTHGTLYGDNTEFFTPYRVGETILGGTVASYLRMKTGPRTTLNVGFIADHRSGSEQFAHPFRPVLSFQYLDGGTKVDIGSYFPERRHGYIEPLEVSTLELTRPIEYGMQLKERRSWI
ncbi:MAG TPA: hypothetical protein VM100_09330, partial [Longimicrobiales bacterium]|nr:hypothetical protein [Longimicrobiales bacterium]